MFRTENVCSYNDAPWRRRQTHMIVLAATSDQRKEWFLRYLISMIYSVKSGKSILIKTVNSVNVTGKLAAIFPQMCVIVQWTNGCNCSRRYEIIKTNLIKTHANTENAHTETGNGRQSPTNEIGACDLSGKRKSAVWNIVFEHVSRVQNFRYLLTVNLLKTIFGVSI